ncbi:oxidoreductase [Aspergillus terreus]|uniref:Oxidoreductase n=1 Tax=Aspergillus terreus TaxID=33178 RepID=A0A5M3Z064_ASPTE|nr:hypothetical protein ATETN484_0007003800 [Aspergillus terreus]GFF15843.1 oxidoreductase [Aspergillus terreus]
MTSNKINIPTVLITGCSKGGIGSALAEAFHERGLHVFATARSISKMSQLENLPNVTLLELDVTCSCSIATAVETVTGLTGGQLNYLINNSGVGITLPILDTDLAKAKQLFDVNLWGTVAVTQAFAPLVIAAKGTIANNASLAAVLPAPWLGFYSASKAAIKAYTETLRHEMGPFNVKVVLLMTGVVETNLFNNFTRLSLPENSLYKGAAKEIATEPKMTKMPAADYAQRVVSDLLAGANGSVWRGKMASICWLMSSFVPTWLMDRALTKGRGLEHVG